MFTKITENIENILANHGFKPMDIGGKTNFTYEGNEHFYRVNTWGKRIVIESALSLEEAEKGLYEDAEVIDIPKELGGDSELYNAEGFYRLIDTLISMYFEGKTYMLYMPGDDEAMQYLRKEKGLAKNVVFYDQEKFYYIENVVDINIDYHVKKQIIGVDGYLVENSFTEFFVEGCDNWEIKTAVFRAYKAGALNDYTISLYDLEEIKQGKKLDEAEIERYPKITRTTFLVSAFGKLFIVAAMKYLCLDPKFNFLYNDHDDEATVTEIKNILEASEFFGELKGYHLLTVTELTRIIC